MTPTVCNEPGCPSFAVKRGRCEAHQLLGTGNTSWGNRRDRGAQAKFRREVGTRFGWRCGAVEDGVRCSHTTDLHAHHTQPGNDDPATGVLLCRRHHRAVDPNAR